MTAQPTDQRVPCNKCPLREKPIFRKFTPAEVAFLLGFKAGELRVAAGASVLLQGTHSAHLYTVLSGWAFRYKMLPDGRRQVLNFALPGDFLGLQAAVFDEMQHSAEALTEVVLCIFQRDKLWSLFTEQPGLAFDLSWLAAREEQTIDDYLLGLGRRSAIERTAYLLLHLFQRAQDLGLSKGNRLRLPFTQQLIADALGMSLVHTNKTLKRLMSTKAVRWKDRVFEILDREALAKIAGYEPPQQRARRPFI